ncbi:transposase [Sphingopyxis terrae subsp. terrae NBRC 15098]|uniref:Transposase n=1 Tax=Sphingopyxis terrae subsp. terrae NBRC 15098 TaxID=1219058 RepID=A0A142VW64_9SPHN|nr:IS110 family transposase [Sphingopyxis terrae]AMU94036.1 transposase [Sphingopyxis terrae subsp. terrae NBRC 15098]
MSDIIRIGMDTSKHVFQLHGVNAAEEAVLRKTLRRKEMIDFFAKLPPTEVAIEACGASHNWGRTLTGMGHAVKLIPPAYIKPYIKRGKNDAADAEAICEAMSRPSMRFVPIKSADNQAALMLVTMRDRLIRTRTQLCSAIRGNAAEFGLVAGAGTCRVEPLLERVAGDPDVPQLARDLFALQAEELTLLRARIKDIDAKLLAWHRSDARSRRVAQIPGVGTLGATLLALKTPAPEDFQSGRAFAAWIGLTPRDHSTGGRVRLGSITRAGDALLRRTLVVGATALLRHIRNSRSRHASPWILDMLKRKPPKLVAVALANKMARVAWKLMVSDQDYRAPTAAVPLSSAA